MKVKEIIEKLNKIDKEKEVLILLEGIDPVIEGGRAISDIFEISNSDEDINYVYIMED